MSYSGFQENYNNPFSKVGQGLSDAEYSASNVMAKFRNNKFVSGGADFLNSNSLVAKVCFLILVIILFIMALRLGSRILTWLLSPSKNPIIVDGLRDGQRQKIVTQKPGLKDSVPIIRSVNERDGIEFTWSVWLWVKDTTWDTKTANAPTRKKHIFNKGSLGNIQGGSGNWEEGDSTTSLDGMAFPNNSPGVYLAPNTNDMIVYMNTYDNVLEEVTIPDIPVNKWINVILRNKGRNLDVYINGKIKHRHVFNSVPKQNYGNVNVTRNGGFSGHLSSLRYFHTALTGVEIDNLVKKGPNLKADDSIKIFPPYFSLRWFFRS
tara:strand:+ start:2977 stop:3936 length:960 start_codon:yes stop_codon:yes gene_type:complete